jgi:hypothetical protein
MTTLHRLVIGWAGPQVVGTAVNILHWSGSDNPSPPVADVKDAFTTMAAGIPAGVTITVPNSGDSIDDTTGDLTGVWATTGGGTVVGTGPANAAAGVGACVGWTTGGIVTGAHGPRKLRGRTFIVPLPNDAYQNDGTLQPTYVSGWLTWATSMMAAGPLAVWHRPTTPGGSDGNSYGVISAKVRDKVAFLSSRRD